MTSLFPRVFLLCKPLLGTLLTICSITHLFAQGLNNPYQPPTFTQTSPEVSAFKRYGEVPVSLYTGVPDISIPLYSVKLKDIEVPISLSYHAGGITVDQEATIVGLGWNLNAGGTITVSPVGSRETSIVGVDWTNWKKNIDFVAGNTGGIVNTGRESYDHGWACALEPPTFPDDITSLGTAATTGMGELDLYRVSLPNRSFSFILHPGTGDAIFVGEKNKCKIERYMTYGFVITDDYGVRYVFDRIEFENATNMPNAWYLTKITDTYSNEIIFEYTSWSQSTLPQASESFRGYYPSFAAPRNISYNNDVTNHYLTAIKTNTQRVAFEYGSSRKDLDGAYLKFMTVIDSAQQRVLSKYKFNYGYFTSNSVGGDYLDDSDNTPSPSDYKSLRLKLESLSQVNPANPVDTLSHVFAYDERHSLPQKTSFAKDFWGYYNGRENASNFLQPFKHTLLPNPVVMEHIEADFSTIDWETYFANFDHSQFANRFSDPDYISIGTLKSIIYPTGGRTELEFEPHDFYNQRMFDANDYSAFVPDIQVLSVSDLNDPNGPATYISDPFQLTESTEARLVGGGDSTLYNLSTGSIGIINLNGGPNYMYSLSTKSRWNVKLTLPAGSYRLVCSAPSDIPFQNYQAIVSATLTYGVYDQDGINAALAKTAGVGGGLRAKKVRSFDENNNLIQAKEYFYKSESGQSSGKLLRVMDNFQTLTITTGAVNGNTRTSERINTFTFASNNFLATHNSTSSVNVGYDRVFVKNVAGATDLGEEISYYVNESPMVIGTYFSLYQNCTNGQLAKKVMLNAARDTIQYQSYLYNQVHFAKHMLNIKVVDTYYGPTGHCDMNEILGTEYNRYNIAVFAYTNFVNQLIKTETYDYSINNKLLTRVENSYDPENYQLDQTKVLTSDSKFRISDFKYPHDYPSEGVYLQMVQKNMLNPVVEQKEYLDAKLLKTQRNQYLSFGIGQESHISPERVKIGFGISTVEEKIIFDKYDLNGNVLQYHKPYENINTIFFRGHGDNRVVAKVITNLSYDQLVSSVGTYLSQLDDNLTSSQLETVNSAIRTSLPTAQVMTYTYDGLLGLKTETDTNGKTTYYEYDSLGRLRIIRDQDQNILKEIKYNYRDHLPND